VPAAVAGFQCPAQAEVGQRQHVRAGQVEDQEHLDGPDADAAYCREFLDDRRVIHAGPSAEAAGPRQEMARKVVQVLDLASGQSAGTQAIDRGGE
jgi:hypothetical protein